MTFQKEKHNFWMELILALCLNVEQEREVELM
jgi:hypothetical protein